MSSFFFSPKSIAHLQCVGLHNQVSHSEPDVLQWIRHFSSRFSQNISPERHEVIIFLFYPFHCICEISWAISQWTCLAPGIETMWPSHCPRTYFQRKSYDSIDAADSYFCKRKDFFIANVYQRVECIAQYWPIVLFPVDSSLMSQISNRMLLRSVHIWAFSQIASMMMMVFRQMSHRGRCATWKSNLLFKQHTGALIHTIIDWCVYTCDPAPHFHVTSVSDYAYTYAYSVHSRSVKSASHLHTSIAQTNNKLLTWHWVRIEFRFKNVQPIQNIRNILYRNLHNDR